MKKNEKRVLEILAGYFALDKVTAETELPKDDHISLVEAFMLIEEELKINIDFKEDQVDTLNTVQDILNLVEATITGQDKPEEKPEDQDATDESTRCNKDCCGQEDQPDERNEDHKCNKDCCKADVGSMEDK